MEDAIKAALILFPAIVFLVIYFIMSDGFEVYPKMRIVRSGDKYYPQVKLRYSLFWNNIGPLMKLRAFGSGIYFESRDSAMSALRTWKDKYERQISDGKKITYVYPEDLADIPRLDFDIDTKQSEKKHINFYEKAKQIKQR